MIDRKILAGTRLIVKHFSSPVKAFMAFSLLLFVHLSFAQTVVKQLYLSAPGQGMDRVLPVVGDATATSSRIGRIENNGLSVYHTSGVQTPNYKIFDGALNTYGSALNAPSVGANTASVMMTAKSPTDSSEAFLLEINSSRQIYLHQWNGTGWTAGTFNPVGGGAVRLLARRSAAIAYSSNGNALLVWDNDAADNLIRYRIWDGTNKTWSLEQTFSMTGFNGSVNRPIDQMILAAKPNSNEMTLAFSDLTSDYALVWNGTTRTWGNGVRLNNNVASVTQYDVNVAYETQSGKALVVYAKADNGNIYYRVWDGSTWTNETTRTFSGAAPTGTGATSSTVLATSMASSPTGNNILLGFTTNASQAVLMTWNGSIFTTANATDYRVISGLTAARSNISPIKLAFESQSGKGLGVVQTTTASTNTLNYVTWTSGSGYSTAAVTPAFTNNPTIVDLAPDTYSNKIMLSVNANTSAQTMLWTGTTSPVWGAAVTQANVGLNGDNGTGNGLPIAFFWNPVFIPTTTFTQTTALCSNLSLPAGGSVGVRAYLNQLTGATLASGNYNIRAVLKYGSTNLITLNTATYNSATGLLSWNGNMASTTFIPAGEKLVLDITIATFPANSSFNIQYDSQSKNSQVQFATTTFINVNTVKNFTAAFPNGTEFTELVSGLTYYNRITVADPFGASDINGVDLAVTNDLGTTNVSLNNSNVVNTIGCEKTYEYAFTVPANGATFYNFSATAKEGSEGTVTANTTVNAVPVQGVKAVDDVITVEAGEVATLNVLTNDLGSKDLTSLAVVSDPYAGSVRIDGNGVLSWLPPLGNFSGTVSFNYQVCKTGTTDQCDIGTVSVTVKPDLSTPCQDALFDKVYYMPFPENTEQVRTALTNAAGTTCQTAITNTVKSITSIKFAYPGTVIYYDHWEDGYETNILVPTQSSSQIWGDGNTFNGIAPGYPTDIIPAGGSIVLTNTFTYNPRNASEIVYDGKDKIYSTGAVSVSKITGDNARFNLQAIKADVIDTRRFGKDFTVGLGEIFPIAGAEYFQYAALFIRASANGTVVNLDFDENGVTDLTKTLNEGDVWFYEGDPNTTAGPTDIKPGARITANQPIGVDIVFGGKDCFGTRNITILPGKFYGSTYFTPVGTTLASNPTALYFVNTNSDTVTINYRSGQNTFAPVKVPGTDIKTYADQFATNGSASGNTGTQNWASNWVEIVEADGFAGGNIRVANNQLEIRGNNANSSVGAYRSANLNSADRATLSFDWTNVGLTTPNDSVSVQIATSSAGPWTTLLKLDNSSAASGTSNLNIDLRFFRSATTTIRFIESANAGMNTARGANFQNVVLSFVPINVQKVVLTDNSGYKFWSDYSTKLPFTAVQIMDATAGGKDYDWAITLIDSARLSTFASIAWAPGNADLSANSNPVWVTPISNTTIYVKYDGNLTGNGPNSVACTIDGANVSLPYDAAFPANAFSSIKIRDTDNDQSGLAVFTCGVPIAAVYGQDPLNAAGTAPTPIAGQSLDVGTNMSPSCLKRFVNAIDNYDVTAPNTPVTVSVLNNDVSFLCSIDPSSVSLSVPGLKPPFHGTAVVNANGSITYTPAAGYQGIDSLEYNICALGIANTCDKAYLIITVTPCTATPLENIVKGDVFLELVPDDAAYNGEALKSGVQVDLYRDLNCNSIVDAGESILQSTVSDASGKFQLSITNGEKAADNFDPTASFTGNDGTTNWANNWTEENDDLIFSSGDVRIIADPVGSNAIRMGGASILGLERITRSLNFISATSAYVNFRYRRQGLSATSPVLQVWLNFNTSNPKLLTTIKYTGAPGTDLSYTSVTVPILLADIIPSGNNTLTFALSGSVVTNSEFFWIDDVEFGYSTPRCYIAKVVPPANYLPSQLNQSAFSFSALQSCLANTIHLGLLARLTASNDAATTSTDVPVNINVLANDVVGLPDPSTVRVTGSGITTTASSGTVTVNANGTLTYAPNPGFVGTDQFQYNVCSLEDPNLCTVALVTVTVSCVTTPNQLTITGVVFGDVNADGNLNVGDAGRSGVGVTLFSDVNANSTYEAGTDTQLQTTTTSSTGGYQFNIPATTSPLSLTDQFNTGGSAFGSDGNVDWSANLWTKINDAGDFTTNNIRILAPGSPTGLRIQGDATAGVEGAYRSANLSNGYVGSATLSYSYAISGLGSQSGDFVNVDIAASPSGPWTTLATYTSSSASTGNVSFNIPAALITATTTIRFVTSSDASLSSSENVYFDNISITYNTNINTYLDQFNANTTASQTNGSVSWSGNSWTEIGESNGFGSGNITITSASGLRITGSATNNVWGASRAVPLPANTTTSATLSYRASTFGFTSASDSVIVQVASSGAGPWTTLHKIAGPTNFTNSSFSWTINPSFFSANTVIRFVSSGPASMTTSKGVNFDDIQVSYVPTLRYITRLTQPIPTGFTLTAPTPSPGGIRPIAFSVVGSGSCQNNFGLAGSDISITKTNTPDPVTAGQSISYRIIVKNNGPSNATGVTVTDVFPSGVTATSTTQTRGSWNGTTGIWTLGSLSVNLSDTLNITAAVNASVATGTLITNNATVSSTTLDPVSSNNAAASSASVITSANIGITKTANISNPNVNSNVVFTLTATNSGPSNAASVTVNDLLPSGYSFVSSSTATGSYNNTSGVWTIGTLANAATATLTITAKVLTTGNYVNVSTISSSTPDPVSSNNTASATVYAVTGISDATVAEGGSLIHNVTLNQPTIGVIQFPYNQTNVTTSNNDYNNSPTFTNGVSAIVSSGVITAISVPAGVSSFSIIYTTTDDTQSENDETYNLTIGGVTAIGTIIDNDANSISVSNPSVTEGQPLIFDVDLTNVSASPVIFLPVFAGVTASLGTDTGTPIAYSLDGGVTWTTWITGTPVTIPTSNTNVKFRIPTTNDNISEINETLTLQVTVTSANTFNISDIGIGTIVDDDPNTISVTSPAVIEGQPLVFDINLSNPSSTPVVFTPSLASLTATVGTDTGTPIEFSTNGGSTYTTWTVGSSITIPVSVTNVKFRVPTTSDAVSEPDEVFGLTINVTSGNTINTPVAATGTIYDNDIFAIDDVGTTVNTAQGGLTVANVLANDVVYATTATLANVNLAIVTAASNSGVQLNTANGQVTVAPGTPVGSYSIGYQICQKTGALACSFAFVYVTVAPAADLQIAKSINNTPVLLGGRVEYRLLVTNNGPSTATNVLVSDAPPAELSTVEFSTNNGSSWSSWSSPRNIGSLANGASTTILIRGNIGNAQCAPFGNTASVSSSTQDPNTANNTSTATATAVDPLSLTLQSALPTANQTVCINSGIQPIVYNTTGAGNNVTVSGLPPNVSYQVVNGIVTITGSPLQFGSWDYTVTNVSSCNIVQQNGTIATLQGTPGTWTGAFDTDWFNCKNWANGIVPNQTIDVVIPSGVTTFPTINPTSPFAANYSNIATAKSITTSQSITFAQNAVLNVSGDVTINNSGKIDMSSGGLVTLTGNWTDNAGANGLVQGSGTVSLTGSTVQNINSAETFNNLIINQAVGSTGGVILQQNVSVANRLSLTNGIIYTNSDANAGYGTLTMGINANAIAGNPGITSFISGKMAKDFDAVPAVPYLLPVGDASAPDIYRPVEVWPSGTAVAGSGNITTFTAEYFSATPPNSDFILGSVVGVVNNEYWIVNKTATGTPLDARVGLFYKNPGNSNWATSGGGTISPCESCNVAVTALIGDTYWDFTKASDFISEGSYLETRYYQDQGWVFSDLVSSFGAFGFGFGSPIVLDVKLISFTGALKEKDVHLNWKILGVKDLAGFEMQLSSNGTQFVKLANVAATNEDTYSYNHVNLAPGNYYYRLLVKDKNGKSTLSKVLLFTIAGKDATRIIGLNNTVVSLIVSPKIYSASIQTVHALITDATGKVYGEYKTSLLAGNNNWPIPAPTMLPGIYFINIKTEDGTTGTLKFMKE